MNNSFQTLQALIDNKIIDIDNYYSVNFRKWSVDLQGNYDSKLIQHLSRDHGATFTIEGGFAVGSMAYQDENVVINFTFT
jgi:hypothetical protein